MRSKLLELQNIHFRVEGKEILKGVNLAVRKGEILSVIGVNGTGKTTLAAIIMGLTGYWADKGKMIFNGKDITKLSLTERAKLGITLAWQIPANFEGITVKEYLSIRTEFSPETCLKMVGLNPAFYLDRVVNESLSGGERKRIELASVLCIRPKLVLLDEPDSGIDMASIHAIKRVIRSFKTTGTSVILITHSEAMARIGDRVALLCDGKIVKEGNIKEVTDFFKKYCERCDHVDDIEEEFLK